LPGDRVVIVLLADAVAGEEDLVALGERRGGCEVGLRLCAAALALSSAAGTRGINLVEAFACLTSLPSVNPRFRTMPSTRARTCATR